MRASVISELIDSEFVAVSCPVTHQRMPNMTRNFDGFYVSYARYISHYGSDTTALVLRGRVFFTLSGNHAADMVEAAESSGIQGCVDLFIDRLDQANMHSDHRAAIGLEDDPFELQATTIEAIGQESINRILAKS